MNFIFYKLRMKGPINILDANKTKLDANFVDFQFGTDRYQYLCPERDVNLKDSGKIVCIGNGFIIKQALKERPDIG